MQVLGSRCLKGAISQQSQICYARDSFPFLLLRGVGTLATPGYRHIRMMPGHSNLRDETCLTCDKEPKAVEYVDIDLARVHSLRRSSAWGEHFWA